MKLLTALFLGLIGFFAPSLIAETTITSYWKCVVAFLLPWLGILLGFVYLFLFSLRQLYLLKK